MADHIPRIIPLSCTLAERTPRTALSAEKCHILNAQDHHLPSLRRGPKHVPSRRNDGTERVRIGPRVGDTVRAVFAYELIRAGFKIALRSRRALLKFNLSCEETTLAENQGVQPIWHGSNIHW